MDGSVAYHWQNDEVTTHLKPHVVGKPSKAGRALLAILISINQVA